MVEGIIALLLFSYLLLGWPLVVRRLENHFTNPDMLSAKIRMARWKAGENIWPNHDDKEL